MEDTLRKVIARCKYHYHLNAIGVISWLNRRGTLDDERAHIMKEAHAMAIYSDEVFGTMYPNAWKKLINE